VEPDDDAALEMRQDLDHVWEELKRGEKLTRVLFDCLGRHPLLSATFFRAAVSWKFAEVYDIRQITRVIGRVCSTIAPGYQHILAPREAEAFVRAELGGEIRLVGEISIPSPKVVDTLQLITRVFFEESPRLHDGVGRLGREIVSAATDQGDRAAKTAFRLESVLAGREIADEFDSMVSVVHEALQRKPKILTDLGMEESC
jgi:hypothetical protein